MNTDYRKIRVSPQYNSVLKMNNNKPLFLNVKMDEVESKFAEPSPPKSKIDYFKVSKPREAFSPEKDNIVYDSLKPIFSLLRLMGGLPFHKTPTGDIRFKILSPVMAYAVAVFVVVLGAVIFLLFVPDRVNKKGANVNTVGKFEEAVIGYLFVVLLLPVLMIPIMWYETNKIVSVLNDWKEFELLFRKISGRNLPLEAMANKSMWLTFLLPLLSTISSIIIHMTLVDFNILRVIPYCVITTFTYMVGGMWYSVCETIGISANMIAEDFQRALKNIGPSAIVADYRAIWLRLSKLTKDTGFSNCYLMTFLCLYLFLTITLSIYGLFSQIQKGLGGKDIGLIVTALSNTMLLFYLCDEAHFASQHVRVNLQKRLLTVELSWMNSDAQTEVNMFLKATDMNPSDISLSGYFSVNRNLFKNLLATMVTYLVVLLQFQISIPEDRNNVNGTATEASAEMI